MRELGTVKEEKLEQLAIMRLKQLLFQNLVFLPGVLKDFTECIGQQLPCMTIGTGRTADSDCTRS